ncbi:ribonuclease HIII [Bacillus sp. HMF5848]|uniref:ribonuclease HIII n=1 Tax=Bacillus sp. HMF5848 TaxID=2495421 RepID=UPI000F795C62|nr:ribonuclease HIII [Bacillus sp. HMF5848]RSK28094.1 ribonuclease HIII [Bacillus sp. HMF5848]
MSHVVLKVTPNILEKMSDYYKHAVTAKIPQGGVFQAKPAGCTITAYKSGKILFQGANAQQEANKWHDNSTAVSSQKKVANKANISSSLPTNFASLSVIGSDEVGTGDYFGPITVVAAFARKDDHAYLKEIGVQDSKNLNDTQIISIAKQLIKVIPYSLLILHNEKYNELQQKGLSQGVMKAKLHNKALFNVLEKISPEKPDAILIDQFVQGQTYFSHIKHEKNIVKDNVYFQTKAEGLHLSVAAASIIARYAFVREIDKLSEKAGFTIPKGAGSQVDIAASKLISKLGEQALPYYTKLHFANTEKAKRIFNQRFRPS